MNEVTDKEKAEIEDLEREFLYARKRVAASWGALEFSAPGYVVLQETPLRDLVAEICRRFGGWFLLRR